MVIIQWLKAILDKDLMSILYRLNCQINLGMTSYPCFKKTRLYGLPKVKLDFPDAYCVDRPTIEFFKPNYLIN